MAVTYCTSDQVAAFLQVDKFTTTSVPTKAQVEDFINDNEDLIDEQTMHAWRSTTVTQESHSLDANGSYEYRDGVDIHLVHRNITALDTGSGDKVEIWNGSSWEDYVVTRTEGRANDFWLDYKLGILFIRTIPRNFTTLSVRVTYRYGESSVNKEIRKACIRLTAIDIIQGDDRSVLFPEGTSNISYERKVEMWQKAADDIIKSNAEMPVIT